MFEYFCVGFHAELRQSIRNTLRYTPIQGEGLCSNWESQYDIRSSFGYVMPVVIIAWWNRGNGRTTWGSTAIDRLC